MSVLRTGQSEAWLNCMAFKSKETHPSDLRMAVNLSRITAPARWLQASLSFRDRGSDVEAQALKRWRGLDQLIKKERMEASTVDGGSNHAACRYFSFFGLDFDVYKIPPGTATLAKLAKSLWPKIEHPLTLCTQIYEGASNVEPTVQGRFHHAFSIYPIHIVPLVRRSAEEQARLMQFRPEATGNNLQYAPWDVQIPSIDCTWPSFRMIYLLQLHGQKTTLSVGNKVTSWTTRPKTARTPILVDPFP